ncbi:hypothetical protein EHQ46_02320 [Leptospira yanagawae]|uniref:ERV/ALR sulfhydryl oxidase domain-containing protein n=1 Tax=Leptospira yanagawae TaxID=293069 RepID=A0ABY2M5U9_9LEPT|nr:hypothetical protein [Leptospira yanagawae]TGL23986.1 hypothetical protein EHQ46_02320 [Leptospira yanagawae]
MACLFCQKGEKSYSKLEPVQDETQTPHFSTEEIVGKALTPFKEIYECKDCHHFWWIRVRGTGDPRSTYPEYYEQTAECLDEARSAFIRNPDISGLISHFESQFPYSFVVEVLEKIVSKEPLGLKALFEKREMRLSGPAKRWIRNWYQNQFPKEYVEQKEKGFSSSSQTVVSFSVGEEILATEWIAIDQLVTLTKKDSEYTLFGIHSEKKSILWKHTVQSPFVEGINIPYLFYHSGYLCYYQGYQKGSEYFSKLNRPNELLVFDLQGNLLLSILLAFRCYEILSTEERDVSENRIVHNFQFSILDGKLYLPHANEIHVYDLNQKQLLKKIKSPNHEPFNGKTFATESDVLLYHTVKGVFAMDGKGEVVFQYKSDFHPVFIDSKLRFYYYYSIVDDIQTGKQKRFFDKKDSGVELTYTLASPPVEFSNRILMPLYGEKTYLLDDHLEIVNEIEFTATDTLGPHSFGTYKTPVVINEENILITNDYQTIVILDLAGNLVAEYPIQSEVLNAFTFDGKHNIVILSCFDDYSEENQVEVMVFGTKGDILFRNILQGPEGISVSFHGDLIFAKGNHLYKSNLFSETKNGFGES